MAKKLQTVHVCGHYDRDKRTTIRAHVGITGRLWISTDARNAAIRRAALIKGDYLIRADRDAEEIMVYDRAGLNAGAIC